MITECKPNESSKEWSSRGPQIPALGSPGFMADSQVDLMHDIGALFGFTYSIRNQMESSIKKLRHTKVRD
ncbi:hypothetical protein MUK42_35864 [Musa troglodytarum]|uniref:Uncharacterized protein n=1 Tax=Musa troglodytarum TaxID=320322 RepID=A0A9E7FLG0_9LILI|nr:hypothetical protein MUK42_35864 [Musa troglodytarum]